MNNYDYFAPFYDEIMGDRSDVIELVLSELTRLAPSAHSLLELGCGTGSVLAGLASKYEVSGLDQSAKMLKIAQHKLPNSRFFQADMSNFELPTKFDAIISIFDTINHLPNFNAWERTFELSHAHLNADGIFIFDFITSGRIKNLIQMGSLVQQVAGATVEIALLRSAPGAVRWHLTIQAEQPDGAIEVYEDNAVERSYPVEAIAARLSRKFEVLGSFDLEGNPPTNTSDRVFMVARAR